MKNKVTGKIVNFINEKPAKAAGIALAVGIIGTIGLIVSLHTGVAPHDLWSTMKMFSTLSMPVLGFTVSGTIGLHYLLKKKGREKTFHKIMSVVAPILLLSATGLLMWHGAASFVAAASSPLFYVAGAGGACGAGALIDNYSLPAWRKKQHYRSIV